MSDIFISYARSTAAKAQQIAEALRGLGYGVWRDDELPAHRDYSEVIEERLRAAKAVVVVWSSEAAASQWVRAEANRAREQHKLVQLTVDGAPLPLPFDQIQCADLTGWTGDPGAHDWKKVAASVLDLVGGARPAAAAPAQRRRSICVLPFVNMSGDPEQEYFSDGISEDIITDLSKVSAISVISRNGAFRYKGQQVDIPQIARDLNVSHVLEGSVRKAGGRVRITAQLIDGSANDHVWAERYDRDLTDIFALQDEISEAIVKALKLKLLPEEKQAIERRGTDSVEAYNLYLMARAYNWTGNEGGARTPETIERLCRRAVEIDPEYAEAWALMGGAQRTLHRAFGRPGDGGQAALDRALDLNPDLAEARAQRAATLFTEGRREEAVAEIAVALRLDPESWEANYRAGFINYNQGRFEEAARWYEKAATLNDTEFGSAFMLISCYKVLNDAENTRRVARIALARAEKAIGQDRSNGTALETGVFALAALGETERAKDWVDRGLLVDPDNLQMRYNFACAFASWLGDREAALDLLGPVLEREVGTTWLENLTIDPDFASLRDNPRFKAMVAAAEARLAAKQAGAG